MNIALKSNNTPNEPGTYVCLRRPSSGTSKPEIVTVRNDGYEYPGELMYIGNISRFPLEKIRNEETMWSDRIEITKDMENYEKDNDDLNDDKEKTNDSI